MWSFLQSSAEQQRLGGWIKKRRKSQPENLNIFSDSLGRAGGELSRKLHTYTHWPPPFSAISKLSTSYVPQSSEGLSNLVLWKIFLYRIAGNWERFPFCHSWRMFICIVENCTCYFTVDSISPIFTLFSTGIEHAATADGVGIDYDSENSDCESVGSYSSGEFEFYEFFLGMHESSAHLNLNRKTWQLTDKSSDMTVALLTLLISCWCWRSD